jgi:hypothetical protein
VEVDRIAEPPTEELIGIRRPRCCFGTPGPQCVQALRFDTPEPTMPATPPAFGIGGVYFGMTPPEGGYVEEVSEEESLETVTAEDEEGDVVVAEPRELVTKKLSMRGRGGIDLAAVVEVSAVALGDVIVESVESEETNTEMPTFSINATSFRNLSD